jgi:hypothetical protein
MIGNACLQVPPLMKLLAEVRPCQVMKPGVAAPTGQSQEMAFPPLLFLFERGAN